MARTILSCTVGLALVLFELGTVCGRGLGEAHAAAPAPHYSGGAVHTGGYGGGYGSGGYGGGGYGGGGYGRVPTPSRPAPHVYGGARESFHSAPNYRAPSRSNYHVEEHRPSPGVRPSIGERGRIAVGPARGGRSEALAGKASNFGVQNHWDHWHAHDLHANWYHGNWHGHWDNFWHPGWHDWWSNPWYAYRPFWGVTGWLTGAFLYNWGYQPYYNPYYSQPLVLGSTIVDYGQPIEPVDYAAAPSDDPNAPAAPVAPEDAMNQGDLARQAFYDQNYPQALAETEQALARMPGDQALHEFRALVLFAMGRYREAAAAVHSILAMGPGWDWTTMIGLYPTSDIYTKQLRALETYRQDNPTDAAPRFLLAYHYLTCGHSQSAAQELNEVVRLVPQDRVAAQLLSMITAPANETAQADPANQDPANPNTANPGPQEPAAATPSTPIDAASLVGNWTARREDGSAIQLALTADSKFTWRYTQGDKTRTFSGTSTIANNLLVLEQPNGQSMAGRIVPSEGGRGFRFLLLGGPPNDPGLTFAP